MSSSDKRVNKTKEQLQAEMKQQAMQVKQEEFNSRLGSFLDEQALDLGLTLSANLVFDPRGVVPKIVVVEATEQYLEQLRQAETKELEAPVEKLEAPKKKAVKKKK